MQPRDLCAGVLFIKELGGLYFHRHVATTRTCSQSSDLAPVIHTSSVETRKRPPATPLPPSLRKTGPLLPHHHISGVIVLYYIHSIEPHVCSPPTHTHTLMHESAHIFGFALSRYSVEPCPRPLHRPQCGWFYNTASLPPPSPTHF